MLLKSRASLTCFRACFLPSRAKDLSATRYIWVCVKFGTGANFWACIKVAVVPTYTKFGVAIDSSTGWYLSRDQKWHRYQRINVGAKLITGTSCTPLLLCGLEATECGFSVGNERLCSHYSSCFQSPFLLPSERQDAASAQKITKVDEPLAHLGLWTRAPFVTLSRLDQYKIKVS